MPDHYVFQEIKACPMCSLPVTERQYFGKRLNQSGGLNPQKVSGSTVDIYKCSRCELIFPNPLPVLLESDRLETTGLEDFWGDRILSYSHFEKELSLLQKLIQKPLNELTVLDIGFGLGNSLATMTAQCKEAHGIEPFQIFYDKALEVNGSKLDHSLLKCERFEDAEFVVEQFDFIFFEAIQHLPDLRGGLEKVLNWLKPGGILYCEVPSSAYLINRMINLLYKVRGTDFVVDTNPMHGNFSYYAFSERCFRENGRQLGYQLIHQEVFPCNAPVGGMAGRILTAVMKGTGTGMQRSIWLRKSRT